MCLTALKYVRLLAIRVFWSVINVNYMIADFISIYRDRCRVFLLIARSISKSLQAKYYTYHFCFVKSRRSSLYDYHLRLHSIA